MSLPGGGHEKMTVLWGRDHQEYGFIATATPARGVALALSRGLHPKPYEWTDPNEDCVAAVVGRRATLLAVADAHRGSIASEAALSSVLDAVGDDPPRRLDDDALVRLFHHAGLAVQSACRNLPEERGRDSRTTLSITLIAGRRLCWAAMGDSPVLVAEGSHGLEVTRPNQHFVGWPMAAHRVERLLQRGRGTLGAGAWVAVVSDGFANFALAQNPAAAAAEVFAEAESAVGGATALVEHAFTGGAGDNVAVAVAAPPDW
jgi:serine/threonine protein phosphatase PrpC